MTLLHGDHGLIMASMVGLPDVHLGFSHTGSVQLQEIGTELAPVVIPDVAATPMYLADLFVALYHRYLGIIWNHYH